MPKQYDASEDKTQHPTREGAGQDETETTEVDQLNWGLLSIVFVVDVTMNHHQATFAGTPLTDRSYTHCQTNILDDGPRNGESKIVER